MKRSFDVGELMLRDDGRTVDGRIVPYKEVARITERNEAGEIVTYLEQFLPHSCASMAQAVKRRGNAGFIEFRMEHENGFDAKIGYGLTLDDNDDGAYASFRLYESRDIDKVRSMLRESHKGLSVNFGDTRPPKEIDGIVSRVQVAIDHVAATPLPCYANAGITAMRGEDFKGETPALDAVKAWLQTMKGVQHVG